jgi:hypothetical protein
MHWLVIIQFYILLHDPFYLGLYIATLHWLNQIDISIFIAISIDLFATLK